MADNYDFAAEAKKVEDDVDRIPYERKDFELTRTEIIEGALRKAFDAGWKSVQREAKERAQGMLERAAEWRTPLYVNGKFLGQATNVTLSEGIDKPRRWDVVLEEDDVIPAEMWDKAVCTRPHALEIPLPDDSTYRPMTTAAQAVLDLADRIEARAKNDLRTAETLRGVL